MLLAIGAGLVGRWSHNQKTIPSAGGVVEVVFALVLIAALDNGRTEDVARGFAWLFLAGVLLSNNSPLTGLANATKSTASTAPGHVFTRKLKGQ
jgi:hypothetical protein